MTSKPGIPLNERQRCQTWGVYTGRRCELKQAHKGGHRLEVMEPMTHDSVEREAQGIPLTRLRGTLALIADGRGPAVEMAQAALEADDEAQGIPLIDVERAFIKGWYAAILYAIDEGGDPTSSIVARRQAAEYVRLASESSRDHVARPVETHQEQQQRLRREEEDRL